MAGETHQRCLFEKSNQHVMRKQGCTVFRSSQNIADAFEVTIDYLVGEGQNAHLDKKNLKRLEELQLLDKGKQHILYDLMDTYIRDAKARLTYS